MPAWGVPWWVWSLVANGAIIFCEYANRHLAEDGWVSALRWTFLPIIVAQYALYRAYNGAEHLLAAWLVFALGSSAMRLIMVRFGTGESFAWWAILGVAMMIFGAYIVKEALHYG